MYLNEHLDITIKNKILLSHLAVILMVTTEHLDWHKDRQEYVDAKKPIVSFQKEKDFAVVNFDFENSAKITTGIKAVGFSEA